MEFFVEKKKVEPIPAGLHDAILYSIIDLGTQYSTKFGTSSKKVMLTWELPEVLIEIDGQAFPKAINKEYTMSLTKKSNLYKDIKSYLGRDLKGEEASKFNLAELIDKPFKLQIIHNETTDGNIYANISIVLAGDTKKKRVNDLFLYNLADKVHPPDHMPEWVAEKVRESEEFKEFNK